MTSLLAITVWSWLERLGGVGLILLGLVDNSPFPVPGSMDALTIILSAHQKDWWPYYAVMATIGGVVGGYVTYALAREGGKEELEKRVSKTKVEKAYKTFSKYGFWSLFVPALAPPPFPFSPFVIAAGAFNYSRKRFLWAVGLGRSIRYGLLAYLGSRYHREIFGFFHEYYQTILWTALAMAIIGGTVAAIYVWRRRRRSQSGASNSKKLKVP